MALLRHEPVHPGLRSLARRRAVAYAGSMTAGAAVWSGLALGLRRLVRRRR